jgi:two-component system, NarL family, sensor kinase
VRFAIRRGAQGIEGKSVGSIMDAAGWSGFAALRANGSANGHVGSTVAQEVTTASPESNISLEGLQRRLSRLAFDVHDGPLQELAALGYELSNLRNKTTRSSSPDPDLDAEFERMMSQLASVEGMLRSMMFTMEEGGAASSDLELVVEQQVDALRLLSPGTKVDVSAEGDLALHTDSQRILVDRVLRESLSNVARHAGASRVSIQLRGYSDALLVRVQDDGRGFDPQAQARGRGGRHVGLKTMRERLDLIGGTLTIDSQVGGPTTITAVIDKWRPGHTDE